MTFEQSAAAVSRSLQRMGRTRLLESLQPGLSAATVRQQLGAADSPSCEAVESLYGWRDGTRLPTDGLLDDIELTPGVVFLSLTDAIAETRRGIDERHWRPTWLPILTDGGGYFYLVELQSGTDHPVLRWEFDEPDRHPTVAPNIASLFATVRRALDDGVIFVDHRGYLEMDQQAFETLGEGATQ